MVKATVRMPVSEKLKQLSLPTPTPWPAPQPAPAVDAAPSRQGAEASAQKATVRTRVHRPTSRERELANAVGLFATLVMTIVLATWGIATMFFR